jgi:hypothetical protein
MLPNEIKRKLEGIIQGNVVEESTDACAAVRNFLCGRFATSRTVKKDFESKQRIKEEQAKLLEGYAIALNILIPEIPENWKYITRGGESLVYLHSDGRSVVKLNDGVYYATWLEYLNSLVIHNILFPDTAYALLGFKVLENQLYAVLKQPFIQSDETANLHSIREYLEYNGFTHRVRQDYFHPDLGLILEDMHDENVIKKGDSLFFIDTVFYLSMK